MDAERVGRCVSGGRLILAFLWAMLALCLPAVAEERSPPDIVLFKARLASFHEGEEGSPKCAARFPAASGRIVFCSDTVSPMSVLEVLLGDLPAPPPTVTLTMSATPIRAIDVFIVANKLPDGRLDVFSWDRSACLDPAYARELGIAAGLAGIYAARQLTCRGWND
ncbi:hypothetical protein [Massilia aquatica]|uniref:Uncharacterized protein n=1 Tax=Massilia aquatica TaxID=2609000 RepID=A0ABX0M333_9BURK|nr:hypothetical protein [Massilia aquatica]NHZ41018.1 hypothetical protein [Massilia aquatica]